MDEIQPVRRIWQNLGLPGIVDVHTHFMPKQVMDKVWGYFDSTGPLVGREWPIRYRTDEQDRVNTLRRFGVRAFSSLVYAHKPQMAEWLNEWAVRFAAYPHELSGGLRQRALIAISLAGEPDLLIADEPTTALDVTIQAQILELLDRLRVSRGMAVLLIAHDLGLVAGRADRVAVMYAGQIVEEAATARLFRSPAHPYTQALFRSIPRIDTPVERLSPIGGGVPSPDAWPAACRFHPRCDQVLPRCSIETPPVVPLAPGEAVRCWLAVREKR